MKLKSITTLALLFVLSFSIVHEYAFALFEDDHCSVAQYISEINAPSSHGDMCDIHFEYHQSFLLSGTTQVPNIQYHKSFNIFNKETYSFKTHLEFFRPPIV